MEEKKLIENIAGDYVKLADEPDFESGVRCLLCGKFMAGHHRPTVCTDCKNLWAKLKFEFAQGGFSHE